MLNFRFESPYALLLLPVVLFVAWRFLRHSPNIGLVPFAARMRVPQNVSSLRAFFARFVPYLFLFGLVMLVIAVARPQTFFARETKNTEAIAIGMVVDISGSMEALDLAENPMEANAQTRLDVVKEIFTEFIDNRPDDLIALVAFGGYASTRSPLTADHTALLQILRATEIPDRNASREEELLTAIGDGLTTACARLKDAEPKSRIIVLLSDGVSNAGIIPVPDAIKVAKDLGIKVYTIGVGSSGRVPFRVRDTFGNTQILYSSTDFDANELKKIASETGGIYFPVRDKKAFDAAMEEIGKLETTKIERQVYINYFEEFPCFVAIGLVALLLSLIGGFYILKRI